MKLTAAIDFELNGRPARLETSFNAPCERDTITALADEIGRRFAYHLQNRVAPTRTGPLVAWSAVRPDPNDCAPGKIYKCPPKWFPMVMGLWADRMSFPDRMTLLTVDGELAWKIELYRVDDVTETHDRRYARGEEFFWMHLPGWPVQSK